MMFSIEFLNGFDGVIYCGTYNLACVSLAIMSTFATQAVAALILFKNVAATAPRTLARYQVIFFGSVSLMLAVASGIAIYIVWALV